MSLRYPAKCEPCPVVRSDREAYRLLSASGAESQMLDDFQRDTARMTDRCELGATMDPNRGEFVCRAGELLVAEQTTSIEVDPAELTDPGNAGYGRLEGSA